MKNTLAIIGMSPGNSFFKDKEVAFLLKESIAQFGKVAIMVADVPAISTYLAMGYSMGKARTKAISKGNNLKNRTRRVMKEIGLDESLITIVDWNEEIKENPAYLNWYQKIEELYNQNTKFQKAVNDTSEEVLKGTGKDFEQKNIEEATHYLLSEIAFLEYAPTFFGIENISYVYHKNRRVYEDYIAGIFDGKIRHHLDFQLLEAPYETFVHIHDPSKSGSLRCLFSPYIKHFEVSENEEYSGTFFNILTQVAKGEEWNPEFIEQSGYGVVTKRLNEGYADVFCSPMRPTKERRNEMFFSESVFQSNIYAYLRSDSTFKSHSLETLKNNQNVRIAIKDNDIHHSIAKEFFPNARLVRVPQLSNVEEVVKYVIDNRADMTFREDKLTEKYLTNQGLDKDILMQKGRDDGSPVKVYENCFAFPWGEFELKKAFDKVIEKN